MEGSQARLFHRARPQWISLSSLAEIRRNLIFLI